MIQEDLGHVASVFYADALEQHVTDKELGTDILYQEALQEIFSDIAYAGLAQFARNIEK